MESAIHIRYGTYGNGHQVRMRRVARALRQRGASVSFAPHTPEEYTDPEFRGDVLVQDIPLNDNEALELIRPRFRKIAVVVGVGHTVDMETTWIADLILYQNVRTFLSSDLGEILSGSDHMLLDPRIPSLRKRGSGTGLYCGAGLPDGYSEELARLLGVSLSFLEDPIPEWSQLATLVTTSGMAMYEAAALGLSVIAFSTDQEHAEDAEALCKRMPGSIIHAGILPKPAIVARLPMARNGPHTVQPFDCLGAYRFAKWILE